MEDRGLSLETERLLGAQPCSTHLGLRGAEVGVVSWGLESGYSLRGGRAQPAPQLEPGWEPFLNGWHPETKTRDTDASSAAPRCDQGKPSPL